jgi:hypothetical protein
MKWRQRDGPNDGRNLGKLTIKDPSAAGLCSAAGPSVCRVRAPQSDLQTPLQNFEKFLLLAMAIYNSRHLLAAYLLHELYCFFPDSVHLAGVVPMRYRSFANLVRPNVINTDF